MKIKQKNTAAANMAILIIFSAATLLVWVSIRTDKTHRPVNPVNYWNIRTDAINKMDTWKYVPDTVNKYKEINNECFLATAD